METPNAPAPQETPDITSTPESTQPILDQEKIKQYIEAQKLEQNFLMALLAGTAASLVGAFAWALVSVTTGYQIGYMAIGVGLLVAYAVRHFGKGIDSHFGYAGAGLALLGCLLGNFFSIIGFAGQTEGLSYSMIFSVLNFSMIGDLMGDAFSPIDLLFYGLAAYEGYKFSFRKFTQEEIIANGTK